MLSSHSLLLRLCGDDVDKQQHTADADVGLGRAAAVARADAVRGAGRALPRPDRGEAVRVCVVVYGWVHAFERRCVLELSAWSL